MYLPYFDHIFSILHSELSNVKMKFLITKMNSFSFFPKKNSFQCIRDQCWLGFVFFSIALGSLSLGLCIGESKVRIGAVLTATETASSRFLKLKIEIETEPSDRFQKPRIGSTRFGFGFKTARNKVIVE